MRTIVRGLVGVALCAAPMGTVAAQMTISWHAGATYSTLSNPIFRRPSGHEEIQLQQSSSGVGGRVGFLWAGEKWGTGLDVMYFKADYASFSFPNNPESPFPNPDDQARYTDPSYRLIGVDWLINVTPFRSKVLGFYGVLGMTNKTEAYTISGADFSFYNGDMSVSEFVYNYGLGVRIAPFKYMALTADMRLSPGDSKYSCYKLGEQVGPNTYLCADGEERPSKMARMMVLGVVVVF